MQIAPALNIQYRKLQNYSPVFFRAVPTQEPSADTFQASTKKTVSDAEVLKAFEERRIWGLQDKEKKGEIENVNWNVVDENGDNLLMKAFKEKESGGWNSNDNIYELVKLANEGKIDVNYVNEYKYSLPQCAIMYAPNKLYKLFELKNLDVTKTSSYCTNSESIVKLAIKRAIYSNYFKDLVCHPSMDFTKYNPQALYKYIDDAPMEEYYRRWDYRIDERMPLEKYKRREYKDAIKTAIKVQNSKKAAQYYKENGSMTLSQIYTHVDNVKDEKAINMPLTDLGGTVAHLLAEIQVSPNDTQSVQMVDDIVKKMKQSSCYFWKEDELGRSPLMLALENQNLVVAKAMLKNMGMTEFKYYEGACSCSAVQERGINHLPVLWNLIADLEPKDRKELGLLLIERSKTKW